MHIEHGRLVCLLGPSGCGKTTTLRLIAGFVEPTAGEIHVGSRLVSSPARTLPPEQRKMSMIFQSYALWPHMTVAENIAYGLKLRKLDRDAINRKLQSICDHAARRPGRPLSRRVVRRPAAARRAGACARGRARDASARRAAVESRRQSARGDALRGPPPARRIPLHHGLRHPRSGGGDDHRRRHCGDESRQDRAGRHAGGNLRAAALGIRRPFHRIEQRGHRQILDGNRISFAGTPLRCAGAKLATGGTTAVSIRQHAIQISAAKPQQTENVVPATGSGRSFSATAATIWLRSPTARNCGSSPRPRKAFRRARGVAGIAAGELPGADGLADFPGQKPNDRSGKTNWGKRP